MKNILIYVGMAAMLAISCSKEKKATTQEAKEVNVVENENTHNYTKVQKNSAIDWRATHFAGAEPRFGKIYIKSADFKVNEGKLTNANVIVDMNSLKVENFPDDAEKAKKLTGHLLSADFFDTEKYPTSTFELTNAERNEGEYNSKLTGNLTLLDATKNISFLANVNITDSLISIQSEKFIVDRKDWGLTYNTEGTQGVPMDYIIADDIELKVDVVAAK